MIQRRLAATVFNCSPQKVRFDSSRLKDIKEAITKVDIRSLIKQGVIRRVPETGQSNGRLKARAKQYAKGRRRGKGSRKGGAKARNPPKAAWIIRIRTQRALLHRMRDGDKITNESYRSLYMKAKGGFFRSQRHIKLYCEEQKLFK